MVRTHGFLQITMPQLNEGNRDSCTAIDSKLQRKAIGRCSQQYITLVFMNRLWDATASDNLSLMPHSQNVLSCIPTRKTTDCIACAHTVWCVVCRWSQVPPANCCSVGELCHSTMDKVTVAPDMDSLEDLGR